MKALRISFLALSLTVSLPLVGCTSGVSPSAKTSAGDPIITAPAGTDDSALQCELSTSALCKDGHCEIMGTSFPATLAGWCSPDQSTADVHISTCGAWKQVEVANGDQPLELYYDADGGLVAAVQDDSEPPCEGSCEPVCIAGPSTLSVSKLGPCSSATPIESACGA